MSDRWIDIPDQVRRDPTAEEILRVWRASDRQVFSARVEHWDDPAAWGLLLADLTRHIARSYAEAGRYEEGAAFERILAGFRAEIPTVMN